MPVANNVWCTIHRVWYSQTCPECIAAAELPDWSAVPNRTTVPAAAPCIPLTPRQRDVMRELLNGLCIDGVAARCGMAVGTARFHRHEVYSRLGVNSQAALMARYMRPTAEAQRIIDGGA